MKASLDTGSIYILTVLFLIFPYFILRDHYLCLGFTFFNALLAILVFTFYLSVAKDISFSKRFSEMAIISIGIAVLTFAIGFLLRKLIGMPVSD